MSYKQRRPNKGPCAWAGCPEQGTYFQQRGPNKTPGYYCQTHETKVAAENLERESERQMFAGKG